MGNIFSSFRTEWMEEVREKCTIQAKLDLLMEKQKRLHIMLVLWHKLERIDEIGQQILQQEYIDNEKQKLLDAAKAQQTGIQSQPPTLSANSGDANDESATTPSRKAKLMAFFRNAEKLGYGAFLICCSNVSTDHTQLSKHFAVMYKVLCSRIHSYIEKGDLDGDFFSEKALISLSICLDGADF